MISETTTEYAVATTAAPAPSNKVCIPGSIYKDKCNVCKCSAYGTSIECTKMKCVEEHERKW